MSQPSLIPPNRLLAWYRSGAITRAQWLEGMRHQFLLALAEIEQDRSQPKLALLETWRCRNAARRLTRRHTETELREVFVSLSEIHDFPPATYLWNADQTDIPLYCFLREKRAPVLRFKRLVIHRLTARLTIQYGGPVARDCIEEKISLRRDWRGVMIVESRESEG